MEKSPWYHWPVALLALVWYLVSAVDYAMTKLRVDAYLSWFTPDQIDYFTNLPFGVSLGWAVGVWAGLLGAILLWARMHSAAVLFALSFVGLFAATVGLTIATTPPMQAVTGPIGTWVMLGAIAVAFVFFLYARAINQR